MKNILVVDIQKGYLDDENEKIIPLIKEYLIKNNFDNVIFTKFISLYKDKFYKNIVWDGLSIEEDQKLAIKKPIYSKEFKRKCYGLTPYIFSYIKSKNIKEIEIVGINVCGAIDVISSQLQNLGISVKYKNDFIAKSKIDNYQTNANFMPNIQKSINGFYFADISYNSIKNISEEPKEHYKYSDITILSFAVMEWLLNTKHSTQELFNILAYYFKLFPNKHIYSVDYQKWAENGCRTYRANSDNLALRMCNSIGWYANSFNEIDELIKNGITPVNNTDDAMVGAKLLCYTLLLLRTGYNRNNILSILKDYFKLDFNINIKRLIKQKQENSCINLARLSVIIFANTTDFEQAINMALKFDCDKKTLLVCVAVLAESYYKNLPYDKIFACRQCLPEKFKNLLMKFMKHTKKY